MKRKKTLVQHKDNKEKQKLIKDDFCKSCDLPVKVCGSLNNIDFCKSCMEAYSTIDGQAKE